MIWILRIVLSLPALIVAVFAHDAFGPIVTLVAATLIIGFAVLAAGWTIRRSFSD
jgi:hypothetical protein